MVQVSVGTLLAFTTVAISLLIIRYVPPTEVPLPSSIQDSIDAVTLRYSGFTEDVGTSKDIAEPLLDKVTIKDFPVLLKQVADGSCKFIYSTLHSHLFSKLRLRSHTLPIWRFLLPVWPC